MNEKKKITVIDPSEEKEVQKPKLEDGYLPVTNLPSKGKFYPEGTKVYARSMKFVEVKMLASMNENNSDDMINRVLEACVKGINLDDMLVADKIYLIFWLRTNTYKDAGFGMDYVCPFCESKEYLEFDLTMLDIDFLKDENINGLKVELPKLNKTLEMKYNTVAREKEIEKILKSDDKLDEDLVKVCSTVQKMDGKVVSLKDVYELLNENPQDLLYLSKVQADNSIGIRNTLKTKCNNCGGTTPVGVTFCSEFFLPEYRL